MNNFFGKINAEWVDPAVELPPDGWRGLAINSDGDVVYATSHVPRVLLGCLTAWLRIGGPLTADDQLRAALQRIHDEEMGDSINNPLACHDAVNRFILRVQGIVCADLGCHGQDAIPRAKVQAAVDEIDGIERMRPMYMSSGEAIGMSLDVIRNHTGVTPTEVL